MSKFINDLNKFENFKNIVSGELTMSKAIGIYFDIVAKGIARMEKLSDEEKAIMEIHHVFPRYLSALLRIPDIEVELLLVPFYKLEHAVLHYCLAVIEDELGNQDAKNNNLGAVTLILDCTLISKTSLSLVCDEATFNDTVEILEKKAIRDARLKTKKKEDPEEYYVNLDPKTRKVFGVYAEEAAVTDGGISSRSLKDLKSRKTLLSPTYGCWIAVNKAEAEEYRKALAKPEIPESSKVETLTKETTTKPKTTSKKSPKSPKRVVEGVVAVNNTTGEVILANNQKDLARYLDLPSSRKIKNDSTPISKCIKGKIEKYVHPVTGQSFSFYGLPGKRIDPTHRYPDHELAIKIKEEQERTGKWDLFDLTNLS